MSTCNQGDASLFAPSLFPARAETAGTKKAASPWLQGDTLASCLTPAGTGAIATLGLWGPRAWDVVRERLQPHSGQLGPRTQPGSPIPTDPEPGRVWLGRFGDEISDEVVVTVQTIRPVPYVEVHCHGGREVIRMLLETLAAHGLRICSWQEFQHQTSADPLQSAAAIALAEAATTRTAGILLDQYHGALSRAIQNILACWEGEDPAEGTERLRGLVHYAGLGRHLTSPWRLVIAGAPNVGKSSLINALAGYRRCVVAPTPGTTRDLVTTRTAIDGWPTELVDTAGLHFAAEALEEEGMRRAYLAMSSADHCLWVLDASAPPVWPDFPTETMHCVINKVDLKAAWDLNQAPRAIRVSALHGSGLANLCDALSHWLVPNPPQPGAAVPFTAALAQQVEEVWSCHAAGRCPEARKLLAEMLRSCNSP